MMPVDDASALETTLERIRQRYALHFNVPPDVKAGEQRNIEVALADNIRRRYPDADVRYRRVYFAPSGGGGGTAVAAQVAGDTNGGAPAQTTVDNERPVQKRRPAVSSDGPRTGPIEANASPDDQPAAASERPRLSRHVDEPSSQPGPIEPRCGRLAPRRRARAATLPERFGQQSTTTRKVTPTQICRSMQIMHGRESALPSKISEEDAPSGLAVAMLTWNSLEPGEFPGGASDG